MPIKSAHHPMTIQDELFANRLATIMVGIKYTMS